MTAEDRNNEGSPGGGLGTRNQQQVVLVGVWAGDQETGAEVKPGRQEAKEGRASSAVNGCQHEHLGHSRIFGQIPKKFCHLVSECRSFKSELSLVYKHIHLLVLVSSQ